MSPQFIRLPGPIPEDICSKEGCDRVVWARDLCDMHYQRLRAAGGVAAKSEVLCKAVGCEKPAARRGLCTLHYQRWRKHGDYAYEPAVFTPPVCAVGGCDALAVGRGWCQKHYTRWKRTGTVDDSSPHEPVLCLVDGCPSFAIARGWCDKHYQRWKTHGDPLFVVGLLESSCPRPLVDESVVGLVPLYARGGMVRAWAKVDILDLEWLSEWRWGLSGHYATRPRGGNGSHGYIYMHREILGLPLVSDGREGDHIDRDSLNNRRSNLRIATRQQNAQNMPSRSGTTSKYRGVSWAKREQKWRATVKTEEKQIALGYFDDEEEAAAAAKEGRRTYLPYAID